jgi:hypothetical protein
MIWQLGWFRIVEQAHHSHLLGHLDPEIWNGHARHMESVIQAPSFDRWWRVRQSFFSPEFQGFINELRDSASAPPATALVEEMTGDDSAA